MRWTWLILLLAALLAAYAFGVAPGALMKRTADDTLIKGRITNVPTSARPDFGEPPPPPPPPPPK